jgi:hypothetical protein
LIFEFFFKDMKIKKLDEGVELSNSKTLHVIVSHHLIYIIVVYLNVLILKALLDKMIININMF